MKKYQLCKCVMRKETVSTCLLELKDSHSVSLWETLNVNRNAPLTSGPIFTHRVDESRSVNNNITMLSQLERTERPML